VKILGISCSPREGGNTEILLGEAMAGVQDEDMTAELISLAGKTINPCDGCSDCVPGGSCHIQDDMQEVYEKMLEADGIIFATPVYFHGMTSQAKALLDRTIALRSPSIRLAGKVGGVIGVAGQLGIIDVLKSLYFYFAHNHMPAADYVIAYAGPKGAVENDELTMKSARELGRQMTQLVQKDFTFPEEYSKGLAPYVADKYQL